MLDLETIKRFSHGDELNYLLKIDSPTGESEQNLRT
jgi:hypothetical protein